MFKIVIARLTPCDKLYSATQQFCALRLSITESRKEERTMSMELSSQRLQEYLRQVIDLEVQCQTADKAYQTCQMKSKGLGVPHVLNKPTKPMERKGILSSFIRGSLKDLVVAVLLWAVLMIVHTGPRLQFSCKIIGLVKPSNCVDYFSRRDCVVRTLYSSWLQAVSESTTRVQQSNE